MSGQKPQNFGRNSQDALSALLDFGPDTEVTENPVPNFLAPKVAPASPSPSSNGELTQRLLRLVKQLQEISKRIDDLDSRI